MAVVAQLDARGIAASQGSACSSHRPEPSHVLLAMGLSEEEAFSTIRLSLSVRNNEEEIERFSEVVADVVRSLRRGT
jgi:cysteine desulfurase